MKTTFKVFSFYVILFHLSFATFTYGSFEDCPVFDDKYTCDLGGEIKFKFKLKKIQDKWAYVFNRTPFIPHEEFYLVKNSFCGSSPYLITGSCSRDWNNNRVIQIQIHDAVCDPTKVKVPLDIRLTWKDGVLEVSKKNVITDVHEAKNRHSLSVPPGFPCVKR